MIRISETDTRKVVTTGETQTPIQATVCPLFFNCMMPHEYNAAKQTRTHYYAPPRATFYM